MEKSASYFDHEADIGVIGRGRTLEEAFEAAALATFAIMTDVTKVEPQIALRIEFDEEDPELALVTWLNMLLAQARIENLALGRFRIQREHHRWKGEAWGEPWRDELSRGTEVKGATLTMLSVRPVEDGWEARCVVDV